MSRTGAYIGAPAAHSGTAMTLTLTQGSIVNTALEVIKAEQNKLVDKRRELERDIRFYRDKMAKAFTELEETIELQASFETLIGKIEK